MFNRRSLKPLARLFLPAIIVLGNIAPALADPGDVSISVERFRPNDWTWSVSVTALETLSGKYMVYTIYFSCYWDSREYSRSFVVRAQDGQTSAREMLGGRPTGITRRAVRYANTYEEAVRLAHRVDADIRNR